MTVVSQPIAQTPIGTVVIGGRPYQVETNPEFIRFFGSLVGRVGGATGPGTVEIVSQQFEDAGIEETKALLYGMNSALMQAPSYAEIHERLTILERRALIPVGGVHVSLDSTNPATTLGYGTWTAIGTGTVLVGVDPGNSYWDAAGETGTRELQTVAP